MFTACIMRWFKTPWPTASSNSSSGSQVMLSCPKSSCTETATSWRRTNRTSQDVALCARFYRRLMRPTGSSESTSCRVSWTLKNVSLTKVTKTFWFVSLKVLLAAILSKLRDCLHPRPKSQLQVKAKDRRISPNKPSLTLTTKTTSRTS